MADDEELHIAYLTEADVAMLEQVMGVRCSDFTDEDYALLDPDADDA